MTYFLESLNEKNSYGFAFDMKTGSWVSSERLNSMKTEKELHEEELDRIKFVKLFTENTANADNSAESVPSVAL